MSVSLANLVDQMMKTHEPKPKDTSVSTVCPRCKTAERPLSEKTGVRKPYCMACHREKMREYRERNGF